MKHNLIFNYYTTNNFLRQSEIDFCLNKNLSNKKIDTFLIVLNKNDKNEITSKLKGQDIEKIIFEISEEIPTYYKFFTLVSNTFPSKENMNILINSDIFLDESTIVDLEKYSNYDKIFLALSRYDVENLNDYKTNSVFRNKADSQDTWVFFGEVPKMEESDFNLGKPGCDNSIAYILEKNGYNVKNPSKSIKTYHVHKSGYKNYTIENRVPKPYKLLPPTE